MKYCCLKKMINYGLDCMYSVKFKIEGIKFIEVNVK